MTKGSFSSNLPFKEVNVKERIPHAIARDRQDATGSKRGPERLDETDDRRLGHARRMLSAAGAFLSPVAYFCLRLIEIAGIVVLALGLFGFLIFGILCNVR